MRLLWEIGLVYVLPIRFRMATLLYFIGMGLLWYSDLGAQSGLSGITIQGLVVDSEEKSITDVAVVLYKGNQKTSADARFTDEKGNFKFTDVTLYPLVGYSLQCKAPQLTGEYSFTTDSVDSGKVLHIKIPLHTVYTPSLSNSKDAIQSIAEDMDHIKNSFTDFVELFSIFLSYFLVLLISTVPTAIIVISYIHFQKRKAYRKKQIPNKLGKVPEKEGTVKKLPPSEGRRSDARDTRIPTGVFEDQGESRRPGTVQPREEPARRTQPSEEDMFQEKAITSYKGLLGNKKPLLVPSYLTIDQNYSSGSEITPLTIGLKEVDSDHVSFLLFTHGDTGLIFPNPNVNFTPDMSWGFPNLTQEKFDAEKGLINPVKAQMIGKGIWRIIS